MKRFDAIYCRVSTKMQDTKSQIPSLKRFSANRGKPVKWFHDRFSGKTMDRPGWIQLETAMRAGHVSSIIVWKLDRLGRTTLGLLKLFDELHERGISLVSLTEGIDLSTPAGRKFARDLASAAEYEREVIGERIREGIAVAREERRRNGKSDRWGGSKKGVRKKVTATQERAIRRMHSDGESIVAIARAIGLSRPTIYSVLRSDGAANGQGIARKSYR
ncbi:MAG: recombinase family protein [Pirellulales bacterium]